MKEKEKKVCLKCGQEKFLTDFYYNRNRKTYANTCKKCNSNKCKEYQQTSGYRETLSYVFYQRAYNIKRDKRSVVMDNLKEYLQTLWEKQEGKCYYTGKKMELTGYKDNHLFMTVDRLIPEKGYTENNIVLCCSIVNRMKQNLTFDELEFWCKEILSFLNKN